MIATRTAILTLFFIKCEAAKILAFSPTPSISHQRLFYPLVKEMVRRGHEVIFVTTNPVYSNKKSPENLQEIDLEDLSYGILKKYFNSSLDNIDNFNYKDSADIYSVLLKLFEDQMKSNQVQNLIKHYKTFDLLVLPAWFRPAMIWSYIYKAPVIKVSPSGMGFDNPENFGAPKHPILYPDNMNRRIYDLTIFEIFMEVYNRLKANNVYTDYEDEENDMMKRIFGPDVPLMSELEQNVDMLLLNSNNYWERNRPLPQNVVYFGHVDHNPAKKLPEDLKSFLDSSLGAIYMNLGSNEPSHLKTDIIEMFLEVFSELPYNVLWKYDVEGLSDIPQNILIRKCFPEIDIFQHPNLKLIITKGSLNITTAAIQAGVPLIGLPALGDRQMFHLEHYMQHAIGLHLDMDVIYKEEFRSCVLKVIEDPSYRDNILRLRTLIHDMKYPALDHAILWTEYVLKHGSTAHLMSPAANISWTEYFEIELIFTLLTSFIVFICCIWLILKMLVNKIEAIIAYQARTEEI